MIIRTIDTFLCDAGRANWVFVRLKTDEGIHGWGEATLESHELAVLAALEEMSRRIIGRDPMIVQLLWQEMYRDAPWQGVVLFTAISGIEQALWDIKGKALGVPAYELLGGRVRDRIRFYLLETSRDTPWRDEIVSQGPRFDAGYFRVSDDLGLGIDLDSDAISRHPGEQRPLAFATRVVV